MMQLPSWVPEFSGNIQYGNNQGVIFAGDSENKIYCAGRPEFEPQEAIEPVDSRYLGVNIVALGIFEDDEICTFKGSGNPEESSIRALPGE